MCETANNVKEKEKKKTPLKLSMSSLWEDPTNYAAQK